MTGDGPGANDLDAALEAGRERMQRLHATGPREAWMEAAHAVLRLHYLAEAENPYRQSGRSGGATDWESTRRCIAEAVHRDGHLLDVGCANGLLLENLVGWCAAKGVSIVPHGIDFVWELVELARRRHPEHRDHFEVANAFWWTPPWRYDFVRSNLEYTLEADRAAMVERLWRDFVAPGGRLILCHYVGRDHEPEDLAALLRSLGHAVAGTSAAPGVAVAWADGPA